MPRELKFLKPRHWCKITSQYPYQFIPRMIFKHDDKWIWQAGPDSQIDISNWKLYWTIEGREILATLDEVVKD